MNTLAMALKFKKLSENAFKPVKGSPLAAGFDLMSAYDLIVPAQGKAVVKTDIAIKVPEGTYGRIAPRSGLAVKKFIIDLGAGTSAKSRLKSRKAIASPSWF